METVSNWTEEQINERIAEIDNEELEIAELKRKNRLTVEDHEDCSDNYQMHLEWGYALAELRDEKKFLIQQRNKLHT